jgi:hypothetical protein
MYFVCRWREQAPFSKRVVTVRDATVLDWFRRGWDQEDPDGWIEGELGGYVYGLESVFEQARKRNLPRPDTVDQLRELLNQHLYVEGEIRLGEHALRVRTDDDEVDLAYYFVDDEAAAAAPDRLAFLLHDAWPLPDGAAGPGAAFTPGVPLRTVRLAPAAAAAGPECVYSVRLCWESPDFDRNLDLPGAVAFPGLTLPELVARLRAADDPGVDRWPHDARLLRALVAPGDDALDRYARLPGYDPSPADVDRVTEMLLPEPPAESLVRRDSHLAQVARYIDGFFGFDQWFLFDTRWAAAHPELSRSLLRYAAHWDPFADH